MHLADVGGRVVSGESHLNSVQRYWRAKEGEDIDNITPSEQIKSDRSFQTAIEHCRDHPDGDVTWYVAWDHKEQGQTCKSFNDILAQADKSLRSD